MARVLVTGATGFIGGHLVQALLARGDEVRCMVRGSSDTSRLNGCDVELRQGALDDTASLRRAVAGVDRVFHLAALTAAKNEREMARVNVIGAHNLVAACALRDTPPTVVFVSSVAAAGPTGVGRIRTECDPVSPISVYGRSKRCGELATLRFARHVPTTIVRPGIVFGPWDRELLPAFLCIRRLRIHPSPGLRPPPLSLVHVADLCEVLIRAAERGKRCDGDSASSRQGIYFATAPEFPTYLEVGRWLARAMGYEHVLLLPLAQPLPWCIGLLAEITGHLRGRLDTLNLDKIREATADCWACSSAAAARDLDFRPRKRLLERLRETADWYQEAGWM